MCKYCGPISLIEDADFESFINNDVVLILFTHDKCKAGKPVLRNLRKMELQHPEFFMGRYNLSNSIEYAIKFNVVATPSLLLFKHGVLIDRVTGFLSEEELLGLLKTWQETINKG